MNLNKIILKYCKILGNEAEVESSRTSLASRASSMTRFEVLGLGFEGQDLGLEAYKSLKKSCPRLEDSTFYDSLKMGHGHDLFVTLPWKSTETLQKIWKDFFWRKIGVFLLEDLFLFLKSPEKKFCEPFFFLFLENTYALCS